MFLTEFGGRAGLLDAVDEDVDFFVVEAELFFEKGGGGRELVRLFCEGGRGKGKGNGWGIFIGGVKRRGEERRGEERRGEERRGRRWRRN